MIAGIFFFILVFGIIGGIISRMCGSERVKLPFGLAQWIYALPYGLVCLPAGILALAGYGAAFAGKRTGHGRGISLGHMIKVTAKPEKLEFLVRWLKNNVPVYWYKVLILAVTGMAVTLLPGILLALYQNVFWGVFLALSGVTKAPAYMIGWAIFPQGEDDFFVSEMNEATEIGEFLTGFFGYCTLMIAFLMAI